MRGASVAAAEHDKPRRLHVDEEERRVEVVEVVVKRVFLAVAGVAPMAAAAMEK
jgi:hypothetical protein